MLDYYAHTPPGGSSDWHVLKDHLLSVAEMARGFAESFGGGDLAYCAGLWHDLGKMQSAFQEYLCAEHEGRPSHSVPHAIWGAVIAYLILWRRARKDFWVEITVPIAGHHAGLKAPTGSWAKELDSKLQKLNPAELNRYLDFVRRLGIPSFGQEKDRNPSRREMFIRMLLSALADADYLDTERHFQKGKAEQRDGFSSLFHLWKVFQEKQQALLNGLKNPDSQVNCVRREVYEACLEKATESPGFFRLTVPTGGGKTRSGLGFAIRHAIENDLKRVIIAIPYTSIIDQTARVYVEEIFGDADVVVHHSRVPVDEQGEKQNEMTVRRRLATENWNAPLVLTTTVQLFESLFSNRPGRVRKLHNLAQSVIVLDEVQALPPGVLIPTLDVLRTLVEEYGTSVIFQTATQPTFEQVERVEPLRGVKVREIVERYKDHFEMLERVEYISRLAPVDWEILAKEIAEHERVMVVLNTRRDALALLEALEKRGIADLYHLSTLLCGAHRDEVLKEINQRLDPKNPQPVRLISTQVVEAGMDFDFPVVYRAVGPLDRIVQAAGRCNREGRLGHKGGHVVVFRPQEGGAPHGPYRTGIGEALAMIASGYDLSCPKTHTVYFERLFEALRERGLDEYEVQAYREDLDFPEVARRYRLIPDDTVPVVITRYGVGETRLKAWQRNPTRKSWQRLQPYVVGVFERQLQALQKSVDLKALTEQEGLFAWGGRYDTLRGLPLDLDDPADLVPPLSTTVV